MTTNSQRVKQLEDEKLEHLKRIKQLEQEKDALLATVAVLVERFGGEAIVRADDVVLKGWLTNTVRLSVELDQSTGSNVFRTLRLDNQT